MKSPETIDLTKKEEKEPDEFGNLVDSLGEHMEETDFEVKEAGKESELEEVSEEETRKEREELIKEIEKGDEQKKPSKKEPFSEEHLWNVAQQLGKGDEVIDSPGGKGEAIPFSKGKEDESRMSHETVESLHDEQGRVIYKKYFQTEEGQADLNYLSEKTKEFFNTADQSRKSIIFEKIDGPRKQLESEIGGRLTIEPNGDVFVEVDGKREKVFDSEGSKDRSDQEIEDISDQEVDIEDIMAPHNLREITDCDIQYLEDWKDKKGVINFTGLKAENLTPEKIKLLKSFKALCLFSDEVKKKIDSFEG